jgi:Zn-dependent protease
MAFLSLAESIDLIVMIAAIGYIFSGLIRRPIPQDYDPLKHFGKNEAWENFKTAIIVAAPALVLHEMAHKITAISFGAQATFHADYTWLAIAMLLRMLNSGFVFLVAGFVSYSAISPLPQALVAFAGPGTNLLLFLLAHAAIKFGWFRKYTEILHMTRKINLFLFIFNMLPLPYFDGLSVFTNLYRAFF